MQTDQIAHEKRKQKRYPVLSGMIFEGSRRGQMADISLGGLSYHYLFRDDQVDTVGQNGTIVSDDDFYLDFIPLQPVSDGPISEKTGFGPGIVRRRSLQFGDLTLTQMALIKHFIWSNSLHEEQALQTPEKPLHLAAFG